MFANEFFDLFHLKKKKGLDRFNWVACFRYRDVVLLQPNSLRHRIRDGRRIATGCRIGFREKNYRLRPGNPVESRFFPLSIL